MANSLLTWSSSCSKESKACVWWIERYFKDCVCSVSGKASFALGLVSLFSWGIAEIPQIVTNFQTKSGHGVSLALLLTWVVGFVVQYPGLMADIFNLVGCLLEPVTLPTQLYTALLYTATTVVLVIQTMYYDYCLTRRKSRGFEDKHDDQGEDGCREPLNPKLQEPSSNPVAIRSPPRMEIYYTSARSLASSGTPHGSSSYLVGARSGPATANLHSHSHSHHPDYSSSEDEGTFPTHGGRIRTSTKSKSKKIIVSRSVGYGTFIAGLVLQPFQAKALMVMEGQNITITGRRLLLQDSGVLRSLEPNPYGMCLGWLMAAIYMGGRLPQIYLNIKRGGVEGLNPLMFMFAIIANATYVGSIVARSMEWDRIKANAPWLLDAIACVLLDLLIVIQFAYYKFRHKREINHHEDLHGGYVEVKKPLP